MEEIANLQYAARSSTNSPTFFEHLLKMDKFLLKKGQISHHQEKQEKKTDLLSLIIESQNSSSMDSSSMATLAQNQWEERCMGHGFVDVVKSVDRANLAQKKNDLKGWRNSNGKKTYSTFRDGKLVTAEGSGAFILAMSDGKKRSAAGKDCGIHTMTNENLKYQNDANKRRKT